MRVVLHQAWSESWMECVNGISYYLNKCQTLWNTSQMTFFSFGEDSALVHMHCACNTVQLLRRSRLPFSWTMSHNSPELKALITRFIGSHTAAWVLLWVKKTEEIKDRLVEFWQCTDTAFEWKNAIFVFPRFCQVMQKHKLFGMAKLSVVWLLTLSVTFLQKTIKMRSRMSKL